MPRIEPYTKAWLCQQYNVGNGTLQKWLRIHAPEIPNYDKKQKKFTPLQLEYIYSKIGEPKSASNLI